MSPPSPPAAVLEAVLYVDDLEAARAFYGEVLGLEWLSEKAGVFVFFRLAQGMLLLFDPDASLANADLPTHGTRGPGHLCFAVAEAALGPWQDRLRAAGVAIEHEQAWPRGGRSFYFRDPAGNSLEMASPRIWGLPEA